MPKYKKYYYSQKNDIPRSTAYRHRQAQKAAEVQVPAGQKEKGAAIGNEVHAPKVNDDVEYQTGEKADINSSNNSHSTNNQEQWELQEQAMESEIDERTEEIELDNGSPGDELQCDSTDQVNPTVSIDEDFWNHRQEKKSTVCPCASSTPEDVMLMCLTLGLRHNLSWKAQEDILKMVNAMYGEKRIPESKFQYLNCVDTSGDHFLYHIYCSECEKYIGKKNELPRNIECNCGHDFEVQDAPFFLSVDLIPQFKGILKNSKVSEALLSYRFNRKKIQQDALEDIQDGAQYRRHFDNGGILSNPYNFSYNFSTDGVPMGRSCGKTIWPLYVNLLDLPPNYRQSYVFLAGLYVGSKDPNQNVFLEPFVEQSNRLSCEGFHWTHKGKNVVSKVIPMCGIVDSVARFQILNMSGINSYYACTMCYQKAVHTVKGQRFPPSDVLIEKRTAESTRADMQEALNQRTNPNRKKRIVKGVKGPTPLLLMKYFSLINSFPVEYMHCILLGVIRTHMELLFDSTRKKFWIDLPEHVGIEHLLSAIDVRLCNISSLSAITRSPRSVTQRAIWKASEWRSWLVFYCIPCLNGLLRNKYLIHLAVLSEATTLLLHRSVTVRDVQVAHKLILNYVYHFNKYFGETAMVLNVHLLTHVAQGVINWGPLWTHNAFIFEGQNRYLLQLLSSPKHVAQQIARKYVIFSNLPGLICKIVSSSSVLDFCESTVHKNLKHFVRSHGVYLLGKRQENGLSIEENDCLASYSVIRQASWSCYQRMLFQGSRYSTNDFARGKKHNDSYVLTQSNVVAQINKILNTSNNEVYILAQEVITEKSPVLQHDDFKYTHVKQIVRYGFELCFRPCDIKSQCVFLCLDRMSYISEMPYGCLGD